MSKQSKFKNLVHYIIQICDDPTKLGATKLNKVLWYVDTYAYRKLGKSISGETDYIKRQFGPVPRNIIDTLKELQIEKKIRIREREHYGYTQQEFVSLVELKENVFNERERKIIQDQLQIICDNHTAKSISEFSHDMIWDAAQLGEEIPIKAVLGKMPGVVSESKIAWANSIIEKRNAVLQKTA